MATHTLQVKDPTHLLGEVRIAREDPTAVLPGPDRILVEPALQGCWLLMLAHPERRASWATRGPPRVVGISQGSGRLNRL